VGERFGELEGRNVFVGIGEGTCEGIPVGENDIVGAEVEGDIVGPLAAVNVMCPDDRMSV